jgi:hypothetical protein
MDADRIILPSGVSRGSACLVEEKSLSRPGFDHTASYIKLDDCIVSFDGK